MWFCEQNQVKRVASSRLDPKCAACSSSLALISDARHAEIKFGSDLPFPDLEIAVVNISVIILQTPMAAPICSHCNQTLGG